MTTFFTLKPFSRDNEKSTRSLKFGFLKRKLLLLTVLFGSFAFNSDAQLLISIGSPVDGDEGLSDITFDVFIEAGAVSAVDISGTISYAGGATAGVDYVPVLSYIIPAGMNSTTITLTVIDDAIVEPTEPVIALLTGPPSLGAYNNTTSTALILDDDASNLTISIGSPVDAIEAVGDVSFVVSLDFGAFNNTGSPIFGTINYSGSATAGSDYSGAPTIFNIPDGQSADTIVLTVIDDLCIELAESVIATISQPSVGTISVNDTSTAYIVDNDSGSAAISIGNPVDGAEGGSDVSFIISIDQGLTNCTGGPITGDLTYSGTATAGLDYSSVSTFSIPDGSSFVLLDIPVVDELDIEPTESVIVTISSPSLGVISALSVDTAYIIDNDSTNGLYDLYLNDLSVTLYPNPVNSTLNIEAQKQMRNYSIADLKGRVMVSGNLNTLGTTLIVEDLPKGFYFLTVEFSDGTLVSKKVLKQ